MVLNDIFLSLKIIYSLSNSAGPDEMPPYVAFHLGFHYSRKYLFTGIQNETRYVANKYILIEYTKN